MPSDPGLLGLLGLLLGLDKLGVVDVAILVLVISGQDRVDHVDQLVVHKDLGLGDGVAAVGIMVGLVFDGKEGSSSRSRSESTQ